MTDRPLVSPTRNGAIVLIGLIIWFAVSASTSVSDAIWFEDIKDPVSVSDTDGKALLRSVEASLSGRKNRNTVIPRLLQKDITPRIVFLSVSDGSTPARVVIGSGKGIFKAIENAVAKLNVLTETDYRQKWIKLDIVRDVHAINHTDT